MIMCSTVAVAKLAGVILLLIQHKSPKITDGGGHTGKPSDRLNPVHQVDLPMRKDIKVSFVSRHDLNWYEAVIYQGNHKASLDYIQFLNDIIDQVIESNG